MTKEHNFSKLSIPTRPSRTNLTRQCISSIRQYIVGNRLGSGDRLPSHQEWAELLGVSVLVVREAFQALQALGVVEVQHGRGTFISAMEESNFLDFLAFNSFDAKFTVEEVIETRAMLDLIVLESCILRATPEAIREMEEIIVQMCSAPPMLGLDSELHQLFHHTMLKASGNRLLLSIGMPLANTFWALGNTGQLQFTEEAKRTNMVEVHAAYLDAIKNRDLSNTRKLIDRHLLGLCSKFGIFPQIDITREHPTEVESGREAITEPEQ